MKTSLIIIYSSNLAADFAGIKPKYVISYAHRLKTLFTAGFVIIFHVNRIERYVLYIHTLHMIRRLNGREILFENCLICPPKSNPKFYFFLPY